jgi:hypothetical protein
MRRWLVALWLVGGTACGQTPASPPTPAPTVAVSTLTQNVAVPRPSASSQVSLALSPVPTALPTVTLAPRSAVAGLPTVETTAAARGPGFLTPVELDLELQQPITDSVELRTLVDGVQQLDGVASVRSDGVHILVRYDSTRVLPARLRDRLRELGHPARAGTDVQNPGDAAD